MKQIEINEVDRYIDAAPTAMNLLFIGDTGIGKTTVIEKYCEKNGIYLKTLILSQLDASEALGIPVRHDMEYNGESISVLDTAIPSWVIDLHKHEKAMLFLDEFLCSQPSVMNSFLNFLSQKRVGPFDLSHVKVVSATNIGHYTFDPDTNILSRFCMFYTVNSTAGSFVNDPRIDYSYEDQNMREGAIFDARSLKPRCYQQLSMVKDDKLYYDFYQGFTNNEYIKVYPEEKINSILSQYVQKVHDKNEFFMSESNVKCCVAVLRNEFRTVRNWVPVLNKMMNLSPDTLDQLREALSPATAQKAKEMEAIAV